MWIRLRGIEVYAYHGVHEHEREFGARFEIDVEVEANVEKAIASDDLSDSVDYVKLQEAVRYLTTTKKFHLIESLADCLAQHVIEQFAVETVTVRIRKPGAAVGGIVKTVEVECQKHR